MRVSFHSFKYKKCLSSSRAVDQLQCSGHLAIKETGERGYKRKHCTDHQRWFQGPFELWLQLFIPD